MSERFVPQCDKNFLAAQKRRKKIDASNE